jgi:hypothetical protein
VVEFYSSSVSKELKGEKETRRCRFCGGSEGGMTAHQFGSSCTEEGGSQRRTARRRGQRGGGADGSWRWEPLYRARRPSGAGSFGGSEGEMKMGRATKWAESQGGCSINPFFFLNFKQDFRFKNRRFEILLN